MRCAIGPLGRPVSESGRLRHDDGGHGRGDRRRTAFTLLTLNLVKDSWYQSSQRIGWLLSDAGRRLGSPTMLHGRDSVDRGVIAMSEPKSPVRDGMRIDWDVPPISMDKGLVILADVDRPNLAGKQLDGERSDADLQPRFTPEPAEDSHVGIDPASSVS